MLSVSSPFHQANVHHLLSKSQKGTKYVPQNSIPSPLYEFPYSIHHIRINGDPFVTQVPTLDALLQTPVHLDKRLLSSFSRSLHLLAIYRERLTREGVLFPFLKLESWMVRPRLEETLEQFRRALWIRKLSRMRKTHNERGGRRM